MTKSSDHSEAELWGARPGVAVEVLRSHRLILENYAAVPNDDDRPVRSSGSGRAAKTPKPAVTLRRTDLPAAMLELVKRYEAQTPRVRLVPLRLVSTGPQPASATSGDELPADDADLVSLSITETIVDHDNITATSLILLAGRTQTPKK